MHNNAQKIMRLQKDRKISKGYRLRPETHNKINRIQKILKTDYDDTLNLLCSYFLKSNNSFSNNSLSNISMSNKFSKK